jgi:Acyl-CoA synthetases (AMP-forming)/AMP-acid ligases II
MKVDEGDVRDFLRGRVAAYKIPRRVLFFDEDELSLTGNAKIRGDELRSWRCSDCRSARRSDARGVRGRLGVVSRGGPVMKQQQPSTELAPLEPLVGE